MPHGPNSSQSDTPQPKFVPVEQSNLIRIVAGIFVTLIILIAIFIFGTSVFPEDTVPPFIEPGGVSQPILEQPTNGEPAVGDPATEEPATGEEQIISASECQALSGQALQSCCEDWLTQTGGMKAQCVGQWLMVGETCHWECTLE